MTYAQILRLIWIDMFVANGDTPLQREHICVTFDISVPQASLDIKRFISLFPARLAYDRSRKGYTAAERSEPAFDGASHSAVALACSAAAKHAARLELLSRSAA